MDLMIPGPAGELEAIVWEPADGASARAACVVCHPHPLFGGTLNSSVVFRTARGLQKAGVRVLRFNFRGVGKSSGEHDGHGGEIDDLGAALDWLAQRSPSVPLWAGGFSFGSRIVAVRAAKDARIERIVLVALPVAKFECSFIRDVHVPGLIVMAGEDEYGTLAELKRQFPTLYPALELDEIPGANHYFEGATLELQKRVRAWAERELARTT